MTQPPCSIRIEEDSSIASEIIRPRCPFRKKITYVAQTRFKNTIPRNFYLFSRREKSDDIAVDNLVDSFMTPCKRLSHVGDRD